MCAAVKEIHGNENIRCDVDENLWPDQQEQQDVHQEQFFSWMCHVLTSLGLVRPVTRIKIKLENHDTPPLLSQLKDHNRFIKS